MTAVTVGSLAITAALSQQTVGDGLRDSLIQAGLTNVTDDSVSGGNRYIVFAYQVDAGKTYGTLYYRIRIDSSLNIWHQIASSWDATSKQGTNACDEAFWGRVDTNSPVSFTVLAGLPECAFSLLSNGNQLWTFGIFIPPNRPYWWDANFWNYGFIFNGGNMVNVKGTRNNPYNTQDYSFSLGDGRMSSTNPITNEADLDPGIKLYTQSNRGIAGKSSDDWVMGAFSGVPPLQPTTPKGSLSSYLILAGGYGALAIKTTP